jgi:hypothetical protein
VIQTRSTAKGRSDRALIKMQMWYSTLVAASMVLSTSTKRTSSGTKISSRAMLRQSRPANLGMASSLRPTGGLLIRSWIACCDNEGLRWRGELGVPRSLNDWRCDDAMSLLSLLPSGERRGLGAPALVSLSDGDAAAVSMLCTMFGKEGWISKEGAPHL